MSYIAKNLPAEKHCFWGAEGGVSTGIYKSMNLSFKSDDDLKNLNQNYGIVAARFGLKKENIHVMYQGFTNNVQYVSEPSFGQVVADGAVTDKKNFVLSIGTADCAPVLLADYQNGIIGAAHAGWRSAFKGVVENTLDLMIAKGAKLSNIAAAVGPCIGQSSYEVSEDFYQQFLNTNPVFERFFINGVKTGFYQFDLEAFVLSKLKNYGVENCTVSGLDTYALKGQYHSFRRNTHLNLIPAQDCFPTEISTIVL